MTKGYHYRTIVTYDEYGNAIRGIVKNYLKYTWEHRTPKSEKTIQLDAGEVYADAKLHVSKDAAAAYLRDLGISKPKWDTRDANFFLHGVQTHCLNTTEMTMPYATVDEALKALNDVREGCITYERLVQSTDTTFEEAGGKLIIDVVTIGSNYADCHDEFDLTDKDGKTIPMTWNDVILSVK